MKMPQTVRVVIFEPDRDLRSALRGMLYDLGFRDILDTDSTERALDALEDNNVDLLISDTRPDVSSMCQTFRDVRHGRIGTNPLPIGISLTNFGDHDSITAAIDAGFDNILLKPISPNQLKTRIRTFAQERKPFVITSDYIGPDRRKKTRSVNRNVRLLDIPNPVQLLSQGMPRKEVMWRVKDARIEIDEEKIVRDVDCLSWLADRISKSFIKGASVGEYRSYLDQLAIQVANFRERLPRTSLSHALQVCNALVKNAERLGRTDRRPTVEEAKDLILIVDHLKTSLKRPSGYQTHCGAEEQKSCA